MDFAVISIIALLFLTNLYTIYHYFSLKRNLKGQATREYAQSLNALLAGDRRASLAHLKQAAMKDSQNIEAYLHIGNLLRESNELQSALKVHKQQTIREGLSEKQTIRLNQALALDFMALGQYEKALEHLLVILGIDKKHLWTLKKQVECYERLGFWDEAFKVAQRVAKIEKVPNSQRLALYKAELCRVHLEKDNEKDGKSSFKEAIKQDSGCASAYYYLGTYYQRKQRPKEALSVFKELLRNAPEWSMLPFENLKEILYDLGNFSDIEQIYAEALKKNPNHPSIKFALADIYFKKGNTPKALAFYQQILKERPESVCSLLKSLKSMAKENKYQDAVTLAIEYLESGIEKQNPFICQVCDYHRAKPFWYCPKCFNWNTMKELIEL